MSEPHSALVLNDTRDLWWNADFLALLARRTGLSGARRVLDVGAGHGHWTRTIARLLPAGARIVGVEREVRWVGRARGGAVIPGVEVSFEQGVAEALPFADDTFDAVTCQTLLMHTPDPRAVVREMVRVLAPGGRLVVAEPSNLPSHVSRALTSPDFDLDDMLAVLRLHAICERGKAKLGLGFNSLGETLVSLADPALLEDVDVWLNDRVVVFAPGTERATRPELLEERRVFEEGAVTWPRDETERYFLAGGGDPAELDALWTRARAATARRLAALETGALSLNEGGLFFVTSARKRGGASP